VGKKISYKKVFDCAKYGGIRTLQDSSKYDAGTWKESAEVR
jgi:hypothetical protein